MNARQLWDGSCAGASLEQPSRRDSRGQFVGCAQLDSSEKHLSGFRYGLELWSPEHQLYRLLLSAGRTNWKRSRIRTVETDGLNICSTEADLLRVSPFMRGPFRRPCHQRQGRRDAAWMVRELGCNYVRLAHYPHDSG